MSPRALRGPPLKFWFNHASCTTIHYMALRLGLTEGRDGCLPLLLGEAMAARVHQELATIRRFRADLSRDRAASASLVLAKRLQRLQAISLKAMQA